MAFDRTRPFNDLPLLPPKAVLETPAVLKKAIAASRALAELKGAGHTIPDQRILVNSIVVQEARLSSAIENIVTTNDEVYRALGDDRAASAEVKEVLRYREALWSGFESLETHPLSMRTMVKVVRTIRGADLDVRHTPGTKLTNPGGEVMYTPPEGEALIREKLANLERFIHEAGQLDPIVLMAVMHYQFEAIHPFSDGNGRTGRILNVLFLVERGLLDLPVLFLSRYILQRRSEYYAGLRAVTEEAAWESWILYMLDAIEQTAQDTTSRIERIRRLMAETAEVVRKGAPRIYSKDLVEAVFRHPYTKIGFLVDAGLGKRETASKYLQTLEELGVIRLERVWKERYYLNPGLLEVLSG